MAIRHFGAATLFVLPIGGGSPIKVGTLQDVTASIKRDKKKLMGRGSFPVEIGLGGGEATVKAKSGQIQASLINYLMGSTIVGGHTAIIEDEAGTVPGTTTYIVTVANSATWSQDLGVRYKNGGGYLQQVSSGPTVGQYSVAAGVYTFAAADASAAVKISYAYTISATGKSMRVANPIQGIQSGFQIMLPLGFTSVKDGVRRYATLTLLCCVSDSLSFATKMGDFMIPEFSAEAQEDINGDVFQWDFSEAS